VRQTATPEKCSYVSVCNTHQLTTLW